MTRTTSLLAAVALLSAAGFAQAQQTTSPSGAPLNYGQGVSREQVRAELNAARQAGQLAPGYEYSGLVGPNSRSDPAVASTVSRSEVAAQALEAENQGKLNTAYLEQGLVGPGAKQQAPVTVAVAKTRNEVKAETAQARAQGLLQPGVEYIGLVGPHRSPARVSNTGVASRSTVSGS